MAATANEEVMLGDFSDLSDDSGSESDSDEEAVQNDTADTNWSRVFSPTLEPFDEPNETFKSDFGLGPSPSPLSVLKKLITTEMMDELCKQTNLYADEIKTARPTAMPRWKPVTEEEFWIFLALNLAMGIDSKPSIHDYWTTNEILAAPFFPRNMSRNRFEDILRALHLYENSRIPNGNANRFLKLGSFMDSLLDNCRSAINPGEILCLDETLMAFKGRLSIKQYNPLKRNRFGIKYFVLVDRNTGVVLQMIPYQGKGTEFSQSSVKELGFGGAAVLKMIQPYQNKNHKIVIDNYFNSPALARKLLEKKTQVLGTAQKRRKSMPKMTTKLKKGEVETYSDGSLLIERWSDRREVVILNTFIKHSMEQSNSSNPNNSRQKPATVLLYNKTMGGVDEMDKCIKYYANNRKTYKWYKKVFFYLIDVAVYNAFKISTGVTNEKMPYKNFLLKLIDEITRSNPFKQSNRGLFLTSISTPASLVKSHLPYRYLTKSGYPARGNCVKCRGANGKGPRVTTQFKCRTCDVWLCLEVSSPCYELYHKKSLDKNVVRSPRVPLVELSNTQSTHFTTLSVPDDPSINVPSLSEDLQDGHEIAWHGSDGWAFSPRGHSESGPTLNLPIGVDMQVLAPPSFNSSTFGVLQNSDRRSTSDWSQGVGSASSTYSTFIPPLTSTPIIEENSSGGNQQRGESNYISSPSLEFP